MQLQWASYPSDLQNIAYVLWDLSILTVIIIINGKIIIVASILGKGSEKKTRKKCGLLPNWGSRRVVKSQTIILENYFCTEHVESF